MGGIGKTALAVEAAHRARVRGWFPGGTLFVDLRGYDDDPVTADQAVLALLDALSVRGEDLPPTAERQYDAYRKLLAERRARMLLILDNASDPSQYVPLLPGADHHRVLITSRDRSDALPMRLIDLETLAPEESVALVTRALHETDERDERPGQEPDALRELVDLCGHLPLALQIAAGMLRRRRHRDIASLVTEIREAGDPTVVLDKGSPGTDLYGRSLVLRPVLETSYRRLRPEQARLLRLLCLAPGTDSGVETVAALASLELESAVCLLEELTATHLLSPVRRANELRWRVHDLVRAFGVSVVKGDAGLREEGEAARERVLGSYLRWARAADDRLRWLPGMPEPERFTDRAGALAWLDSERAGMVAAVQWAREEPYVDAAVRLSERLAEYLDWRRSFDDKITVCGAARDAAHRAGNRVGEASAWTSLGIALHETGRVEEAIDAHTRARDLFRTARDRHSEAFAWGNLGTALQAVGRTEEAIDAHTRTRDLFQAAEDHLREAMAWDNLGNALQMAGRTEEAIDAHTRARDLHQAVGDRHGEAAAWNNLGATLRAAGRVEEAVEAYVKALVGLREFDNWYETGRTLSNLARAHKAAHRPTEARTAYLQSAAAYTRANAPAEAAHAQSAADSLT
ncbi:tetratricopeptide repeat protein [Streptomyces prunicolor]|uniref:tetratricopeptide repeat protein n=1 Tax=Streptomyces prunicolor TaxID=67348 RepID=UPI0022590677|nr:tetratricopeptide repeat protein [Streptomyces prunicolor]MCX5237693.1 tetratricopeptide repeat protein [Streptomyces prunicolor]